MDRRKLIDYSNRDIAESFRTGSTYLIRGSRAWDTRELTRLQTGSKLISFGDIQSSIETNGRSARYPSVLMGSPIEN